ncbi:MAG: hypothetical protein PHR82_06500 [Endomicrobiaceae bacterium]|nr:hypothetical protein [Endomicrobiaceae bacterium]
MLTAKEARKQSYDVDTNAFWINSIISKIYDAISNGLLHCQWYAPVRYDCIDEDVKVINDIKDKLETNYGYRCRLDVLKPNKYYRNTRVKMYIGWE